MARTRGKVDAELDAKLKLIYERYGTDLSAFFRDAQAEAPDDGYQAVGNELGPDGVKTLVEAHNKAQARIREAERQQKRLEAALADANERADKAEADAVRLKSENVRLREALANAKGAAFVRLRQEEWDKELDMLARFPMLEADAARLRAALEKYADKGNWQRIQHPNGPEWPVDWIWYGDDKDPIAFAQAALSPRQPESEGK